jgi:glycosyltransferase involved in cell wall biosynthesis
MRILHTVGYYFPDPGGGAQEVVRRLSEGLVLLGHDVTVATTHSPRRQCPEHNGVKIEQFRIQGLLRQSVLGIYGETDRFCAYLKDGGFDIVMNYAAQTWGTDLTYRVLGQMPSKTVLAACGYSGLIGFRRPIYWNYFRRLPQCLRRYDAVVYHSAAYRDKEFGDRHGIEHYRVIPNAIDTREFAECKVDFRRDYGIRTQHLILSVGDHFRNKGHARLLEAFAALGREDATLVIIGRDFAPIGRSCWRICRAAAGRSGGRVLLLANAPRDHVVGAFRSADVFWSGSHIEVFPLVILEAMGAGVPFVAFPAGNIAELPGGCVVTSAAEMATETLKLLGDAEQRRRLGDAGREEQRRRYAWDTVTLQWERLYKDLIAS